MPLKAEMSPEASLDYYSILLELFSERPGREDKFAHDIDKMMLRLSDFPELGQLWPLSSDGLRTQVIWDYLAFYRVRDQIVTVVRIIHGARDIETMFLDD